MAVRYRRVVPGEQRRQAKPREGVILGGWRDDYDVDTGRRNLDPAKLGRILRRADQGDHRAQQEAFSACLEDPHVHTVFSKRIRRVLSRTFQIMPAIEEDEGGPATQAANLCRKLVLGEEGAEGIENWREALWHLGEATARGFALAQIVWADDGGMWRPVCLERWMARDTQLGDPRNAADRDRDVDEIRILTKDALWAGEPLEPYQWVVHVRRARSDALAKCALLRMVVWWWLFKHFSSKDWVIFAERYGMPLRLGKYPFDANQDERDALMSAIITLGKDGGAIMPDGTNIELVETAVRGQLPYEPLVATADAQISKAVLGQTLTTEAGTRGARSLGEVHQDAEADIADDDAMALAETIKRYILTPIVRFNMPPGTPIPSCGFLEDEQVDLLARAQRDKILAKDIGVPMGVDYFYETYDVRPPEDGEAVVSPPPPPPAFGAPPADGDEDAQQDEPPDDSEDEDA